MSSNPHKIVVGVDGSETGRQALDWALQEARLRGAQCLLVHAWNYGMAAAGTAPGSALELISEDARTLLKQAVSYATQSGDRVDGHLVFGNAADVLVEASKDADLLVVGSRGRSRLVSSLLGSVSTACVHHAACPVMVVPPTAKFNGRPRRRTATAAG